MIDAATVVLVTIATLPSGRIGTPGAYLDSSLGSGLRRGS